MPYLAWTVDQFALVGQVAVSNSDDDIQSPTGADGPGGMDSRPIVNIAAERDFLDPADFSRACTREFGYSPKEARFRTRPPTQPQASRTAPRLSA